MGKGSYFGQMADLQLLVCVRKATGLSAEGPPLGLQIIGRPFDEETMFSLAEVIEQAAGTFAPARWW